MTDVHLNGYTLKVREGGEIRDDRFDVELEDLFKTIANQEKVIEDFLKTLLSIHVNQDPSLAVKVLREYNLVKQV